jgi:hypothetical protein
VTVGQVSSSRSRPPAGTIRGRIPFKRCVPAGRTPLPAGHSRGLDAILSIHEARRTRQSRSCPKNLLSWVHTGFSFYAGPAVEASELTSLESQARYITRPALAMDALQKLDDGNLALETPPDPRTGATSILLDPLEWIHRITSHIPDPGRHCQRFYGAYSICSISSLSRLLCSCPPG